MKTSQQQPQIIPRPDPNKARANLGLITAMLQHNVPQAPPEAPQAPQTQETAPQQPQSPQPVDKDTMELNGIKQQIKALTLAVEQALMEDKKEDVKS